MNTTTAPHSLEVAKAGIARQAAQYPQYRGKHANWQPVRFKRDVRTKMGLAFAKGDVTLADLTVEPPTPWDRYPGVPFITAFSARNQIDTAVRLAWVEVLLP